MFTKGGEEEENYLSDARGRVIKQRKTNGVKSDD